MHRLLFTALLSLISLGALAQPDALHSVEIAGGAGWSNIDYRLSDMHQPGDIGGLIHLGYNIHPTRWLSFGIGVDIECDGANAIGNLANSWEDVTDSDGENYKHWLQLNNWHERQDVWLLQIPLVIQFIVPADKASFSIQMGAKWGTRIGGWVHTNGITTHTGYYEPWHLTLSDMQTYGFYTTTFRDRHGLTTETNYTWHLFAKAGVIVPLTSRLYLTAHLYADYSLTDLLKQPESTRELGVRNDREDMETIHYFMPEYSSILDTDYADLSSSKTLNVGLEVGLRFVFKTTNRSHKKRYPCRCVDN